MRVICSFDHVVSEDSATRAVLSALAAPGWQALEDHSRNGHITAAECLRRQIALIDASQGDLDGVLDAIEIDPAFARFVAWCETQAIPVVIVSDGVDRFIDRVLARHGLTQVRVIANELVVSDAGFVLAQPRSREGCAAGSGVCKCDVAVVEAQAEDLLVYVGQGRTDFCVSARAEVLFAKGELAEYAAARKRGFFPYKTFDDIAAVITRLRQPQHGRRTLRVV